MKQYGIKEFSDAHSIAQLSHKWLLEKEVKDFLNLSVTGGVVLSDVLTGDGMRDQISPALIDGFHALMGDNAASADQIRAILFDKLMQGDASALGLVNKIKGQIGENIFVQTAKQHGLDAHLANSGSQEAWDVAITPTDGITQYIQVKTYADADVVIEHMQNVSTKVEAGLITDGDTVVHDISFAVPQNIYESVLQKAHDAGLHTKVIPFDLTAHDAAQIVQDGFDSVSMIGLGHFLYDFTGGTLTAAALHLMVNAYLLHKGAIRAEDMRKQILEQSICSSGGIAAALCMESVVTKGFGVATGSLPAISVIMATALTTRGLIRRLIERNDTTEFIKQENAAFQYRIEKLT